MTAAELQRHVFVGMLLPTTHSQLLPAWGLYNHVEIFNSPLLPEMSGHHLRCGFSLMLQIKGEAPSRRATPPSRWETGVLLALLLGNTLNSSVLYIQRSPGFSVQTYKSSSPPLAELSTASNARRLE